jgi:bisphosphoglycerate-independent phosphoglycerate mutase (AlkP superfamily)
MKTKILCILDGFGLGPDSVNNAISKAKMPNLRRVMSQYFWTTLDADGEAVGQEAGLVGNSEVGHMNIGGLQLVPQLSYQITHSADSGFEKMQRDQLINPKYYLKNSLSDVTFASLEKGNNLISKLLSQSYENLVKLGLGTGESIAKDKLTLTRFFHHLVTWYTLSDLTIKTINQICDVDFNNKKIRPIFQPLQEVYTILNAKTEEDVLNNFAPNKTVHLIGLFSTGTIHSDLRHWAGAIEAAAKSGMSKIVLHIISDGRDSDKKSLVATWQYFIKTFDEKLKPFEDRIFLGSLGGRFYGMDRDKNWERIIQHLEMIFSPTDNYPQSDFKKYNQPIEDYFREKYEEFTENKSSKSYWWSPWMRSFYTDLPRLPDRNYWNETYSTLQNGEKIHICSDGTYFTYKESDRFIHTSDFNLEFERLKIQSLFPNKTVTSNQYINEGNFDEIENILKAVTDYNYKKGAFDENIVPITMKYFVDNESNINPNDTIWILNFRSDRIKQLTQTMYELNNQFDLNLDILTMNDYGIDLANIPVEYTYPKVIHPVPIFKTQPVQNTLAQTIAKQGQTQLHIAETEKYAHVTYFFNGGKQTQNPGEDWELVPSNKVKSHAEQPEMKAEKITDYILEKGVGKYNYIVVNYANPDMVAHTGMISESIASVEFLDQQLERLLGVVERDGHSLIITADHGNCEFVGEYMKKSFSFSQELNKQIERLENLTDTEHNPNSVPCIIVDSKFKVEDRRIEIYETFLSQVNVLSHVHNFEINSDQLENVFLQQNQQFINDQRWVTQEQIHKLKENQLPLWYAGVILLSL